MSIHLRPGAWSAEVGTPAWSARSRKPVNNTLWDVVDIDIKGDSATNLQLC